MTLCPVALAVGCRKCPVFAICPAKSLIGDQAPYDIDVDVDLVVMHRHAPQPATHFGIDSTTFWPRHRRVVVEAIPKW